MSQEVSIAQEIQDRIEFFLVLAFLCGCGFLAGHQLFFLLCMLLSGGTSAALVGLDKITQEKFNELDALEVDEFEESLKTLQEAKEILSQYKGLHSKNSKEVNVIKSKFRNGVAKANQELERKQDFRKSNKHVYGAPPDPITTQCPCGYSIRVTENLPKNDPHRGIYYFPDEKAKDYKSVVWCFKTEQEAVKEGYRRPKRS